MHTDHAGLTDRQLDGLTTILVGAVLLYIASVCLPVQGNQAVSDQPFSKETKGNVKIAVNMDGIERGVYFLPAGATISDLLLLIELRLSRELKRSTNSRPLQTGEKVYLKNDDPYSAVITNMNAAQALALDLPIDLNKATVEELVLVPGIGEKTGARIILLRQSRGYLRSIDELKEISGIKDNKLRMLRGYFKVVP